MDWRRENEGNKNLLSSELQVRDEEEEMQVMHEVRERLFLRKRRTEKESERVLEEERDEELVL